MKNDGYLELCSMLHILRVLGIGSNIYLDNTQNRPFYDITQNKIDQ